MGQRARLYLGAVKAHEEIEEDFPKLNQSNYTITSCTDGHYNCLSWAVGDISNKWDSSLVGKGYYWLPGVGRDDTFDQWAEIFKRHGYEATSSAKHEKGFDKVAIYGDDEGAQHVARQLQDGSWTSKLGDGPDIQHATPEILEGDYYGRVVRLLKRRRIDWD